MELIAVADRGVKAWAWESGVSWQSGCECEQCRQTVTRAGYIIQSTAGLLDQGVSGVGVLLVRSSTTDRELRASGQPSHWPNTTSRGDGRHDASFAASASYRETLPM